MSERKYRAIDRLRRRGAAASRPLCLSCLFMGLVWVSSTWLGVPTWGVVALVGVVALLSVVGIAARRGRTVHLP